ncbi:MAG: hypothetical protein V4634_08120 [Pseudomonadota bacterium]
MHSTVQVLFEKQFRLPGPSATAKEHTKSDAKHFRYAYFSSQRQKFVAHSASNIQPFVVSVSKMPSACPFRIVSAA